MLAAFASNAQNGVRWMTWQQAIQAVNADKAAGRTPKVVMVDVYTNWCAWCKRLEANLGIGYIANFVNLHFYPVKFDAESHEAITFKGYKFGNVPTGDGKRGIHQLAYSLLDGEMGYPTVVFLNEDLNIMQRIRSSMDEKTLYTVLNYMVSDDYGVTAYPDFEKKFNKEKKLTNYQPTAKPAPTYQPQTLVPPRK